MIIKVGAARSIETHIDVEDEPKVLTFLDQWSLSTAGYVHRWNGATTTFLHHTIFGQPPEGFEVDHKNRNPLDNRKDNLRLITHRQNIANRKDRSRFGTNINQNRSGSYKVEIKRNGVLKYIGSYKELRAAQAARNSW